MLHILLLSLLLREQEQLTTITDPAAAQRHYQQLLQLQPSDSNAHAEFAQLMAGLGRFDESLGLFKQALELTPAWAHARSTFAETLELQKRFAEAADQHAAAVMLAPQRPDLYFRLGLSLHKLWTESSVQSSGRHPQKAWQIPRLLEAKRNLALASTVMRAGLQLSPAYVDGKNDLGVMLREIGIRNESQALELWQQALALSPDHNR